MIKDTIIEDNNSILADTISAEQSFPAATKPALVKFNQHSLLKDYAK